MKILAAALCLLLGAAAAHAQSEAALKEVFEGRRVVVKIDMPATSEGVDVFADARQPIDFGRYAARLKAAGTALRPGDAVMITRIRVKEKHIEFHLGGGGFGTFGDDTSTSVYVPSAAKSNREKNLERDVKAERDAARKRRLQEELDDLRRDREREDARNRASAAVAEGEKRQRVAEQRLHGGSRFNIRYPNAVPPGVTAAGIMAALAEYVEFPSTTQAASASRDVAVEPAGRVQTGRVRKGMTLQEAEAALGRAERTTDRMEGTLKVTTAVFSRDDQRIEAEFVEGVLIRYSISSR